MRYDGDAAHNQTRGVSNDHFPEPLLVRFMGRNLTVNALDVSFQMRQLYSFKYWERNWELKSLGSETPSLMVQGRNVLVVVQDYDPPQDAQPSPTVEIQSTPHDVRGFFVGEEIAMNVRLSIRSQESILQWASRRAKQTDSLPMPHQMAVFQSVHIEVMDVETHKVVHHSKMRDDGNNWDAQPHDGIYGATFKMSRPGTYEVHIRVNGSLYEPHGTSTPLNKRTFFRSSMHVIKILPAQDQIDLEYLASVHQDKANEDFIDFYLPLKTEYTLNVNKKFKAHAQVYGVALDSESSQNASIPVGFMSGMVKGEFCPAITTDMVLKRSRSAGYISNDNRICLKLKLSKKWLSRSQVGTQYFLLKNIFVQDVATSIPLGERAEMRAYALDHIEMGPGSEFTGEITERMQKGPRPAHLQRGRAGGKSVLVVSHGYCADESPFTLSDFSNFIAFRDLNQNRHNDDFALRLYEFVELHPEGPFDRYSFVAHSQGGLASTHLITFYWTGADNHMSPSNASRIVQSVGSPYLGTAVAGYIAAIGRLVGIACGSNFDLTHEGAAMWSSLIPRSTREHIYYTTTTWEGNFSYCSLPLNSVLTFKNDGACENQYGNLEHANPVAQNLPAWCHTRTMNFPSQCTNSQMNYDYNANAAR